MTLALFENLLAKKSSKLQNFSKYDFSSAKKREADEVLVLEAYKKSVVTEMGDLVKTACIIYHRKEHLVIRTIASAVIGGRSEEFTTFVTRHMTNLAERQINPPGDKLGLEIRAFTSRTKAVAKAAAHFREALEHYDSVDHTEDGGGLTAEELHEFVAAVLKMVTKHRKLMSNWRETVDELGGYGNVRCGYGAKRSWVSDLMSMYQFEIRDVEKLDSMPPGKYQLLGNKSCPVIEVPGTSTASETIKRLLDVFMTRPVQPINSNLEAIKLVQDVNDGVENDRHYYIGPQNAIKRLSGGILGKSYSDASQFEIIIRARDLLRQLYQMRMTFAGLLLYSHYCSGHTDLDIAVLGLNQDDNMIVRAIETQDNLLGYNDAYKLETTRGPLEGPPI